MDQNPTVSTFENHLSNIWLSPKTVFNDLIPQKQNNAKYIILFLYSFSLLNIAPSLNPNLKGALAISIFCSLTIAPIIFLLFYFVIYYLGKQLGGEAKFYPLFTCLTYAQIPAASIFILKAINIYIFESDFYSSTFDVSSYPALARGAYSAYIYLGDILVLWSSVLSVVAISVNQKFTYMKSLLNLMLPTILFIVFILYVFGIVYLLR